jgi:hypothetical protein
MVPDPSLLARCEASDPAFNVAARAADGSWALMYLGGGGTVAVCPEVEATWISPVTGERSPAGTGLVKAPEGWEDAVLVVE